MNKFSSNLNTHVLQSIFDKVEKNNNIKECNQGLNPEAKKRSSDKHCINASNNDSEQFFKKSKKKGSMSILNPKEKLKKPKHLQTISKQDTDLLDIDLYDIKSWESIF